MAPFDGKVSAHLVSVGELVGSTNPTKLATIVQLDPIYVIFNVSQNDVLHIGETLRKRGIKALDITKVPVEVGLTGETGYPHKGMLDYLAPALDASTGTLEVRGQLDNGGHNMLPGFFARVHVARGSSSARCSCPASRSAAIRPAPMCWSWAATMSWCSAASSWVRWSGR